MVGSLAVTGVGLTGVGFGGRAGQARAARGFAGAGESSESSVLFFAGAELLEAPLVAEGVV